MKQRHSASIDTKGLRKALTTVAVAGALAGWAVLARPETPVTTSVFSPTTATQVVVSNDDDEAAVFSEENDQSAVSNVVPATANVQVASAPIPVTTTRSSR